MEKVKGKPQKTIHYYSYCKWASDLRKKSVGPVGAKYAFPNEVLAFLREVLPKHVTADSE